MTPFVRKKQKAVDYGYREEALTIESEITDAVAKPLLARIDGQTASSFLLLLPRTTAIMDLPVLCLHKRCLFFFCGRTSIIREDQTLVQGGKVIIIPQS
ncbi:MAG: hypothetical protein ACOVO3_12225 [Fluviicola sp.]